MDKARNKQLAKVQIERLRADHLIGEGYSDIPELHSGYYISIDGHPSLDTMSADKPWLITQIKHQGYQPQVLEAFAGASSAASTMPSQLHKYLDIDTELQFPIDQQQGYFNVFNAIPQEISYRPALRHPKPKILGTQTAIVTGAAGEEIYCDEYGRIKVQFHWDREGTLDENSSHWIRVASNWAHDGYGTVVIPRVGMEVKVDFLEGDPDNPIVTGAIHNGINKVPYDLPANKTRSVFKTSSSKGGIGSNELRIEDKAGQEQIFVQAQKDFDQLTKNNHTIEVKNNTHLQVQNEHSETIVKNRYTHNQSEEHHLTQLDRKTQIMMNDYKTVGMAEHETIGTIKTTQAGMEIHLKAGLQTVIDGGLSLTLKAGGQHIVLNPAGIWMTMPVWTGGVPMEGTPAAPLPPLNLTKTVAATTAPPVVLAQRQALLAAKPRSEICTAAGDSVGAYQNTSSNTNNSTSNSNSTTETTTGSSSASNSESINNTANSDQETVIRISRQWDTANSTISTFTVEGTQISGYFLERPGPDTTTPGQRLRIPQGTYKVRWHDSPNFGKSPNLYNAQVPYTRYILIHGGNTPEHTDGCLLAGTNKTTDWVGASQAKLTELKNYLNTVDIDNVKIIITNDF